MRQIWTVNSLHHPLLVLKNRLDRCNAGICVVNLLYFLCFWTSFQVHARLNSASWSNDSGHQLSVLKIYSLCFLLLEHIVLRSADRRLRIPGHRVEGLNRFWQITLYTSYKKLGYSPFYPCLCQAGFSEALSYFCLSARFSMSPWIQKILTSSSSVVS